MMTWLEVYFAIGALLVAQALFRNWGSVRLRDVEVAAAVFGFVALWPIVVASELVTAWRDWRDGRKR